MKVTDDWRNIGKEPPLSCARVLVTDNPCLISADGNVTNVHVGYPFYSTINRGWVSKCVEGGTFYGVTHWAPLPAPIRE